MKCERYGCRKAATIQISHTPDDHRSYCHVHAMNVLLLYSGTAHTIPYFSQIPIQKITANSEKNTNSTTHTCKNCGKTIQTTCYKFCNETCEDQYEANATDFANEH